MAKILPFKAIRPTVDKVCLIASRSVDGYKSPELKLKLMENPYTFLHVINPDFTDGKKTKPGSPERLKKTKLAFEDFINQGYFLQDEQPGYYIYQQRKDGFSFVGIIARISIDDYYNGTIKIHEQTLTEREEKLKEYLEVCDFNAEPILFSFPNNPCIEETINNIIKQRAEYDFTTTDKIRHTLWPVLDAETCNLIQSEFAKINAVYIADGHHRSASSALLGKSKRDKNKNYTGEENFNYYMGIFFPENQLKIFDFNRVVKDLNGLSTEQFITKLSECFEVEKKGNQIYKANKLHNFSMYLDGNWYSLNAKKGSYHTDNPVGTLDVAILSNKVLSPILGIHDLKTDKRIGFVSGIKGMEELKAQVDLGKMKVAFGMYPVSMEQLKHIADTHNIMPPKSTWVEPKMRSGLVIYSLAD